MTRDEVESLTADWRMNVEYDDARAVARWALERDAVATRAMELLERWVDQHDLDPHKPSTECLPSCALLHETDALLREVRGG